MGQDGEANNHILTREKMISDNPALVEVQTGQLIGYLGYSGLTFEPDYFEGHERPYVTNPSKNGTYSIPHLHMDEFMRNHDTGKKDWRRDPYNVYARNLHYPTHSNQIGLNSENLFFADEVNLPKFSDS